MYSDQLKRTSIHKMCHSERSEESDPQKIYSKKPFILSERFFASIRTTKEIESGNLNRYPLFTIHFPLAAPQRRSTIHSKKVPGTGTFFLPLPLAEKPIAMSASGLYLNMMEWISWHQSGVSLQPFTSCNPVVLYMLALFCEPIIAYLVSFVNTFLIDL